MIQEEPLKISRLIIKNYRNLKDIDICLGETVVLIGENNSGKSNLLRAATLPFLTDESSFSGKSLSWIDINEQAQNRLQIIISQMQKAESVTERMKEDNQWECIQKMGRIHYCAEEIVLNKLTYR